jgi:iron complex transport system substrate-binding protein
MKSTVCSGFTKLTKVLLLSTIIACQSTDYTAVNNLEGGGIKVVDSRGKAVKLVKPAKRVVVLYQAALDAMYMLHAEHTIVGIQQRIYLDSSVLNYFSKLDPRIAKKEIASPAAWESGASAESIVQLEPDLVIMAATQTEAIALIEQLGIPVFGVASETNEQLFNELAGMGELTGTSQRAEELINYAKHKIQTLQDRNKDIYPKKSVYYAWSGGRIYSTSGRNSRISKSIEMAGAENACPYNIDAPNVNPETLISWNPDVILLWNTNPEVLYEQKELAVLPAVKRKAVYSLDPPFYYDPHTLKVIYTAVVLNILCYPTHSSYDLDTERKDILSNLYGDKAALL